MSSVVFVHGTGVRKQSFGETFDALKSGFQGHGIGATLLPCYWGDTCGARLHFDGKSIPDYAATKAVADADKAEPAADPLTLWALLFEDPLLELRLLEARGAQAETAAPGKLPFSRRAPQALNQVAADPDFLGQLKALRLEKYLAYSLAQIATINLPAALAAANQELAQGASNGDAGREVLARALVMGLVAKAVPEGVPAPDEAKRDELIAKAFVILGGSPAVKKALLGSVLRKTLTPAAWLLKWGGTLYARERRGAVSDAFSPFPGDVLVYQGHGKPMRDEIRKQVNAAEPPVYILAHSLGGIASFELLLEPDAPTVAGLITAGSQAPLLYELGALALLRPEPPASLPPSFPRWLNFYDPNDMLGYIAGPVFQQDPRIKDVKVRSGQPFPQAHSAYWSTQEFWDESVDFIK